MRVNLPCETAILAFADWTSTGELQSLQRAMAETISSQVELINVRIQGTGGQTPDVSVAVITPSAVTDSDICVELGALAVRSKHAVAFVDMNEFGEVSKDIEAQLISLGWTLAPFAVSILSNDRGLENPPLSLTDAIMPTVWHTVMRGLRRDYWAEATSRPARVSSAEGVRGPNPLKVDLLLNMRDHGQ